jgi:glycosyltransferase involved in cell wall biosynthesis
MKLSVIIATYNRWRYLGGTLSSVLAQDHPEFQVIVVDQTDPLLPIPAAIQEHLNDSRISYFRVGPPSLPAARNFGLAKAVGAIVVFIDDDVELPSQFLRRHEDAYRNAEIGAVAGRVLDTINGVSLVPPRFAKHGVFEGWFTYGSEVDTNAVYGCNMSFRREVLMQVGMFDTGFTGNALREESDMGLRVAAGGWRIVYSPDAYLTHLPAPEGGCREANSYETVNYYKNNILFLIKNFKLYHPWRVWKDLLLPHVYPHKSEPIRFWKRFRVFSKGAGQAYRHSLLGRQIEQQEIWRHDHLAANRSSVAVSKPCEESIKISILLNNFNYARYVGSAIESVLGQTYGNFEFIIVDDGSTDNSRQIISKYKDPRVVTLYKENAGQGSAFRDGISKATGEYIAFLDADDTWDLNKLERCVQILRSEPTIVLLNHSYREIDAEGSLISVPHSFDKVGRYDLLADVRRLNVHFSLVPTSFFIGRRKECLQVEIDVNQWKIGADTPVAVGLGLRGGIYNFAECLGSYRRHPNNLWLGRYNDQILYQHFQRFYRLVNAEMRRLGKNERFDFSRSEFAITQSVLRSSKYSLRGIYYRLRWMLALRQHSDYRNRG